MKRFFHVLCTAMLCLSFAPVSTAAGDLTILYTGNTHAEYKPCPT